MQNGGQGGRQGGVRPVFICEKRNEAAKGTVDERQADRTLCCGSGKNQVFAVKEERNKGGRGCQSADRKAKTKISVCRKTL